MSSRPCNLCGKPVFFAQGGGGGWVCLDAVPRENGTHVLDEDGNAGPATAGATPDHRIKYVRHNAVCQYDYTGGGRRRRK